ncbi:MAG: nucleotidyltransferase family protein [candidate division WOR-3 bacterium]|nr:nucleotidyltransferase family protein [candidate division WOR-3 bacterium]
MKTKTEIEETLRESLPLLAARFHVGRIGIFGSYVRGEQTEASDVDILVEFSAPIGWEIVDLKDHLEQVLGMRVDLVTIPALKPQYRDRVLREVVYA